MPWDQPNLWKVLKSTKYVKFMRNLNSSNGFYNRGSKSFHKGLGIYAVRSPKCMKNDENLCKSMKRLNSSKGFYRDCRSFRRGLSIHAMASHKTVKIVKNHRFLWKLINFIEIDRMAASCNQTKVSSGARLIGPSSPRVLGIRRQRRWLVNCKCAAAGLSPAFNGVPDQSAVVPNVMPTFW